MKNHPTVIRVYRFGLSGLLATGVHVATAAAFLTWVAPEPVIANGLAFTVATVVSYLANTLWSFSATLGARTGSRFLVVSGVGCLLSMLIAGVAARFGASPAAGIAFVVVLVPPLTFAMHHGYTYR